MFWSIHRRKLTSNKALVQLRSTGLLEKARCCMPRPTEQAERLLALARRDITSFRALSSHPEVDISATGFFAQQSVEKCLKAVALHHSVVFRKTHDLDELDVKHYCSIKW
ncbi:MAG: HEPN domain-containing protein [Rhodoferax sp.]|nr:HEPN domain-containing protein [Rhodoferax sp.]